MSARVEIRYCIPCGYHSRAISLTDKLLATYKDGIGEVALVPSDGGVFEVSVDGDMVHSKLQTGMLPDERVLVQQIGTRLS